MSSFAHRSPTRLAAYREVWLALRYEEYVRGKEGGSMLGWLSHALQHRAENLAAPYGHARDFVAIKQFLHLVTLDRSVLLRLHAPRT